MLAGIGSMQADVPPQMIEIDAVGAPRAAGSETCTLLQARVRY